MSEQHHFESKLTWIGEHVAPELSYSSYTRTFEIRPDGKPVLPGSSPAVFGGEDARYNPEDLLLASLSSCHMLTFLAVAAKARVKVLEYTDAASGTLAIKDGKMRFVEVTLRPRVKIENAADFDKVAALHDKAFAHCFIANSVNFPVTHRPETFAA